MSEDQVQFLDESEDRLRAMLKQEETTYRCTDYLSAPHQPDSINEQELKICRSPSALSVIEDCAKLVTDISLVDHSQRKKLQPLVDPQLIPWRFQMCNWAYSVTDRLGYSRAVVAITFDLLDRYIAKTSAGNEHQFTMSCFDFQLLCMAAFYLAVKVNEPSDSIVSLEVMVEMSRGIFSVEDLEVAEQELLEVLQWHISPPTAYDFLGELFDLWEKKNQEELCQAWVSRSYQIVEITIGDVAFLKHLSSQQALAAMLVAGSESGIPSKDLNDFCENVRWMVDIDDPNFLAIYDELYSSPKD
mmetsp:Transcript_22005/g.32505  ORF Transcript_22005/g.32505 Transcript_22005/m.32505 type:complete len:301 (+) Transcript_22005:272-1174(+)|eukprot:CAMPEP_0194211818 /NCGR_PEP_ID=MMETSP0156-20130528/11238_1 /TAXON_ID=33649 /ORGANISM="Thalassionema nitzschioides, Strain L26-B" /LENGTH=300 /DNA_ID=CAMNT_0038939497 /DNA_START=262 /DNA_END=1164 /DNA_ORIENTATION=+